MHSMTKTEQYQEVLKRLKRRYKKTDTDFVAWKTPLELVVATVLSAQCTDKRVNIVTKELFKKYKTARAYAKADLGTLKREIYSTGFYNSKAKYLKGIGERLVEAYRGKVPNTLDDLLTLPGVSHKTANLVMEKAFGIPTGIAVDTHVKRIAPRLGWTKEKKNTVKIELDLNKLIDPKDYLSANEYLILLGRDLCKSTPTCTLCPLQNICPMGMKQT